MRSRAAARPPGARGRRPPSAAGSSARRTWRAARGRGTGGTGDGAACGAARRCRLARRGRGRGRRGRGRLVPGAAVGLVVVPGAAVLVAGSRHPSESITGAAAPAEIVLDRRTRSVRTHRRRHRPGGRRDGGSVPRPPTLLRIAETRSRRCLGDRSLNASGCGAGRRAWPGEVGRGQLLELAVHGEHQGAVGAVRRELAAGRCGGLSTTARPSRRPDGTWMMSPRRRVARTRLASARCADARLRDTPRSASVSCARIAAYSMKSPRSQLTCRARSAASLAYRRSRRVRPTTPRSAWNWAKLDSSRAAARLRPTCAVRLTAML